MTAGFLVIGLLKTPLRWSGAALIPLAVVWAASAPLPDVLIGADGRDVHDKSLGQGINCDPSGCIGKLADGALVSYAVTPEAYDEDCARAVLVVATRGDPPADCRAMVIGRAVWRARGALALRRRISTGRGRRPQRRAKASPPRL